jgi:predicted transposase YbfD/YdcC
MHCTVKKTFQLAAEADIDLIVQIKDNQPGLHRQVHGRCASAAPLTCASSIDKARSRQERRTVAVFDPGDSIVDPDWRACVAAIIRVERDVFTRSASTGLWDHATNTACYLSNMPITAARAAEAIRAHWTIENTSHHSRDVTMGEDASRIRCNPGVFARLRSFGYNILKANRTGTLAQDRYRAALGGIDQLLEMVDQRER